MGIKSRLKKEKKEAAERSEGETRANALQALAKVERVNMEKCNSEIAAILRKYGYSIQVVQGWQLVPVRPPGQALKGGLLGA